MPGYTHVRAHAHAHTPMNIDKEHSLCKVLEMAKIYFSSPNFLWPLGSSPLGLINPCIDIQEEASGGAGNDRVRNLQSEVEGVKNIMTQNVERILARGENLDHLRNKTEDLEATVRWGANWGRGRDLTGEGRVWGRWRGQHEQKGW